MKNAISRHMSGWGMVLVAGTLLAATPARSAEEVIAIPKQEWSFNGMTGHFDKEQLRRGYLVYKNLCAVCHGMRLLHYRILYEPGGPEFAEGRVQEFAAEAQVTDGPDDSGEMVQRPGRPSDRFVSPYPNPQAAAAANGGAYPPDLSVMAKARTVSHAAPWYMEPFYWISDLATGYQEQGADYLYALLMGYQDPPPAGVEMGPGMYYNSAFPGHQIAMPPPLSDGVIEYPEGSVPATVENYSRDVTAFLMWAAEPKLEERKRMGLKVLVYLIILTGLLYLSKRALWRNVKH